MAFLDVFNISGLIRFNPKEVKQKYIKNGKFLLNEIFTDLKSKNYNVVFSRKGGFFIECKNYKASIMSNIVFSLYPSMKILFTGAKSEKEIHNAIEHCFKKVLNKIGIKKYKVLITNIMFSSVFDYNINLDKLMKYSEDCKIFYNPEIFCAASYESKYGFANIFANGKVVIIVKNKRDAKRIIKQIEKIISITKAAIPLQGNF